MCSSNDNESSDASSQVRALLEEIKAEQTTATDLDSAVNRGAGSWHDMLLEALDSCDLTPGEIHRKRKKLTFLAFQDPMMVPKVIATERLMRPNASKIFLLFSRSEMVATLQRLPPTVKEERHKLQEKLPGTDLRYCMVGMVHYLILTLIF